MTNPMKADGHIQFLRNVINQDGKEMNVLDENIGILHPHNASALEFAIFQIKMQLTATLGLALIRPVDRGAAFSGEGDGDDPTFAQGFGFEAVNDIDNLFWHLYVIDYEESEMNE